MHPKWITAVASLLALMVAPSAFASDGSRHKGSDGGSVHCYSYSYNGHTYNRCYSSGGSGHHYHPHHQYFPYHGCGQRFIGDRGSDTFRGTPCRDWAEGRGGRDWLFGRGGRDFLDGGRGSDWLRGGAGADWIRAGHGADDVRGGRGNDVIDASDRDGDRDYVNCGPGWDRAAVRRGDVVVNCERVDWSGGISSFDDGRPSAFDDDDASEDMSVDYAQR